MSDVSVYFWVAYIRSFETPPAPPKTCIKYHNLTNTTTVRTWRDDAIDSIKSGDITYEGFMIAFEDESLASELFRLAGVPIDS